MKKAISKALLRLAGWKLGPVVEDVPKCVICVAPHTSNWDFIVGKLFYTSIGRNASFLIKKEWFFFPFNLLFDWLGGVPVDRSKRTSVTDQMVGQFNRRKEFQKEAGFKGVFYPTGDADKDIRDIREHYRGVTACHPENFVQI